MPQGSGDILADYEDACRILGILPHPNLISMNRSRANSLSPSSSSASGLDSTSSTSNEDGSAADSDDGKSSQLTELQVCGWSLDLGTVTALSMVLPNYPSVTKLRLWNAGLTLPVMERLVEVVKQSNIQKFFLDFTSFDTIETAKAVVKLLQEPTPIRFVSLRGNDFGDDIAVAIFDALKINTTVGALNISSNKITDVGFRALATALQSNRTLRKVSLSHNRCSGEGAAAIASSLCSVEVEKAEAAALKEAGIPVSSNKGKFVREGNSVVSHINMSQNTICDKGGQAVLAVFPGNEVLNVCLQGNSMSLSTRQALKSTSRVKVDITAEELEEEATGISDEAGGLSVLSETDVTA